MKRNIIRNLFPALVTALVIVSCQVDSVTESTVVTRLEKNVYEVGENVRFHFSGEADFVTIFTGVDNYNGGTMGGTIKGSRYIYRNRGRENGSPVLSFNCKKMEITWRSMPKSSFFFLLTLTVTSPWRE